MRLSDLTITPQAHWCARHLQPFRAEWPRGYLLASMALFEEAARREDVARACGWNPESGEKADTELLGRVLREFGPLCCLVGDETTRRWARLALHEQPGYMSALAELRAELPEWAIEQSDTLAGAGLRLRTSWRMLWQTVKPELLRPIEWLVWKLRR